MIIPNRTAVTLEDYIDRFIMTSEDEPTTLITDGWAGYSHLAERGYNHIVEVHEDGIFGETGATERLWNWIKMLIKHSYRSINPTNL